MSTNAHIAHHAAEQHTLVETKAEHPAQRVIDRIIVAYDGSDLAREAFAYATMLASAVGCGVLLLHVLETEPAPRPTSMLGRGGAMLDAPASIGPAGADAQGDETLRLSQQLDELAAYCRLRGLAVEKEMTSGELLAALRKRARKHDLIAIGLKGRFAAAGPGSTTRKLLHQAPCPVMVISGELHPVMRINIAYDGTAVSERAMRFAQRLADSIGWPLAVFAIAGVELSEDEIVEVASQRAPGATVLLMNSRDQTESQQVLRLAEHGGYALYVFGAFPDSWLHQMLFGGTTAEILRELRHPLVLVH